MLIAFSTFLFVSGDAGELTMTSEEPSAKKKALSSNSDPIFHMNMMVGDSRSPLSNTIDSVNQSLNSADSLLSSHEVCQVDQSLNSESDNHFPSAMDADTSIESTYEVDGVPVDESNVLPKPNLKPNKSKTSKLLKDQGKEYENRKGVKRPKRILLPRCAHTSRYHTFGCHQVTEETRDSIFKSYYKENLQEQRNFIARHVTIQMTRDRPDGSSKKKGLTLKYHLTISGEKMQVCKSMFLSTIGHTCDQQLRTSLQKSDDKGFVNKEGRGGARNEEFYKTMRQGIMDHINLYPRVESHYTRKDSSCHYLHPSLTLVKIRAGTFRH